MSETLRARPVLSICIPSYNRPELIGRLLRSLDASPSKIEIVICEDKAPRQAEVRSVVEEYSRTAPYEVRYRENAQNIGYDRNLRELISDARGEFVMYMGDDDHFVPGALDRFIEFLGAHDDVAYVLRSYQIFDGGHESIIRYFPKERTFEPGFDTYVALFRKSVTLAGFTFRRAAAAEFITGEFDGTLLFQLYLAAELTLRWPAVFCDFPVAIVEMTWRTDNAFFGASAAEKGSFVPGKVLPSNSVNFMRGFFRITEYLDRKYGFDSTSAVRRDISKYSYPVLSIQRKRGALEFLKYVRTLSREIRINRTPHYYVYAVALLIGGERLCDRAIVLVRSVLGRTPQL